MTIEEIVKCSCCGKVLGDALNPGHPDLYSTECWSCQEVAEAKRGGRASIDRHEVEFELNQSIMRTDSLTICSRCRKTEAKCVCEEYYPRSTIDDRTTEPDEEDYEEYDEDY